MEHAKAQLAASQLRLQETLKDFKLMIIWSVTLVADVADANISLAEHDEKGKGSGLAGNYDLIAMATHGRSGFQHWILGSITERVLGATKLPILIVRPEAAEFKHALNGGETSKASIPIKSTLF